MISQADVMRAVVRYLKANKQQTIKQIAAAINRSESRTQDFMRMLVRSGEVRREKKGYRNPGFYSAPIWFYVYSAMRRPARPAARAAARPASKKKTGPGVKRASPKSKKAKRRA